MAVREPHQNKGYLWDNLSSRAEGPFKARLRNIRNTEGGEQNKITAGRQEAEGIEEPRSS